MRNSCCVFLFAFVVVIYSGTQESNSNPVLHPFTIIRAGAVIDGKSDSVRRNQIIIIRGNRIESISDASAANVPAGDTMSVTLFDNGSATSSTCSWTK